MCTGFTGAEFPAGEQHYGVEEACTRLSKLMGKKRFQHSLRTAEMALQLARRHGVDERMAYWAGLLHDCARELSGSELLAAAHREGLPVTELEKQVPVFLHGPVGAVMARKQFGIHEVKVLRAIAMHTTGAEKMGLLDKIVFVADKVEAGRHYRGVVKLRELAFTDLNACILACLERGIKLALGRRALLHPEIVLARNALLGEGNKSRN